MFLVLHLEEDIVQDINQNSAVIGYDLPYVLTPKQLENLENLVENAPVAYSIDMKESSIYPSGTFIRIENLEIT